MRTTVTDGVYGVLQHASPCLAATVRLYRRRQTANTNPVGLRLPIDSVGVRSANGRNKTFTFKQVAGSNDTSATKENAKPATSSKLMFKETVRSTAAPRKRTLLSSAPVSLPTIPIVDTLFGFTATYRFVEPQVPATTAPIRRVRTVVTVPTTIKLCHRVDKPFLLVHPTYACALKQMTCTDGPPLS